MVYKMIREIEITQEELRNLKEGKEVTLKGKIANLQGILTLRFEESPVEVQGQ